MKPQTIDIYVHMRDKGPITPLVALEEYGCFRLPARIAEIKDMGVEVKDQWVTHVNQDGQIKRFKEYWI